MKQYVSRPMLSLRVKLALSYLLVALGAVLILALVVSLAMRNYFEGTQKQLVHSQAEYMADSINHADDISGGNWSRGWPRSFEPYSPILLVVVNAQGQQLFYAQPKYLTLNTADTSILEQALAQALQGQEVDGHLQGSAGSSTFSGYYSSVPLRYRGQSNGQLTGAMLLAVPERYPRGLSPNDFLVQVNEAIFVAGIILSLIVILFSLLLARRLTRPLESLTAAAEKMKGGKYTERVEAPRTQDELGRLALTFNAMADTIEADVTELRRQEQVRRELIANIAHDLATPLTAIQGFSEALADDIIPGLVARQETAQLIGREVQRLRRLVADMQQLSSFESGHIPLDLAPLDMHALVEETVTVIVPECEQAGICVYNEIAPTTPLVLADSDRITQVLLNLLDNARRHTPRGGKISITATAGQKKLVISVNDTGVGIDPANLPHIFERFYRADPSRTGTTGGSGLGLSIVKAIITAHCGTIWAESTPGKGTRIAFTLPLAANSN